LVIDRFEIHGFKRFSNQGFRFAPLTVLAGLNGAGKTSLIHALLLTRQAASSNSRIIQLNGPHGLELGTAADVANWLGNEKIAFCLESNSQRLEWEFEWSSEDDLHLDISAKPTSFPLPPGIADAGAFTYLSPERLGPRASYKASAVPSSQLGVGVNGEHCAQILATLGDKPISDATRRHPTSDAVSLLKYDVERWLGEVSRQVEIEATRYSGSTLFGLRYRDPDGTYARSTNMGFGVTYALPIILAGLTLPRDGILIVENPEAHLHPGGQSRIGGFLAWLAGKGLQVIIETHSDHVINGSRRAIGEQGYVRADEAVVHFFEGTETPNVRELSFTEIGGISHWPPGFFDQYQLDIAALGRVRRGDKRSVLRS
jgi:predicted ATPase